MELDFSSLFGKVEMEEAAARIVKATDGHLRDVCVSTDMVCDSGTDNDDDDAAYGLLLLIGYGWIEMDDEEHFRLSDEFIAKVLTRIPIGGSTTPSITARRDDG
jgi:hypothetical protein